MTSLSISAQCSANQIVDQRLITKYDRPGPRYTSYPTADRFSNEFGVRDYRADLAARASSPGDVPLSLYIHLPFCNTVCFYCGCNKIVTRDHSRSATYLRHLEREFELVAQMLSGSRRVTQLHLGGGTPTFLSDQELRSMMSSLARHFELLPGEYAIEIDPRTVDATRIAALAAMGFNRMSLGVQDFDPAVQAAVNRVQSPLETANAITAARRCGVTSINVDLIYGLPKQTVAGFRHTLEQVVVMHPDRIALYSYAHLPGMFKPQRRIEEGDLPDGAAKLEIMASAVAQLAQAGYAYIGMDHFALQHDELAIAQRDGRLHRNFQGYSTQPDCDLIAFGISAISKVGATYSQNVKTLDEYYAALDRGELPVARGIALGADDRLRRDVIQAVMCNFALDLAVIEATHAIRFRDYFAAEWRELEGLARDGLVTLSEDRISVTATGRFLVRIVAMVFDRYVKLPRPAPAIEPAPLPSRIKVVPRSGERFSRAI